MRCKLFPTATPPPAPAAPTRPAEIRDFTRVDLPWRNQSFEVVRCVDGTQPAIYVDPAVIPSDNWVFTFQGGGSCSGGEACLEVYLDPGEQDEMGTARDPAMQSMQGIHRPSAANSFANANRIRIQKCGYDRYNGNATMRDAAATVDSDWDGDGIQAEMINDPAAGSHDPDAFSVQEGADLTFDLFHHGKKTVLRTLDELRDGLTFDSWAASGGAVSSHQETLPPLKDAAAVLFAGHSGAAHGLMNSIDSLVDHMAAWTRTDNTPFDADVRVLFDAHLIPTLESEAAFNEHLQGNVFDRLTLCRPPCESGPPLHYTYDGMAYYGSGGVGVSGYFDGPHEAWSAPLDTSCLAAHPGDPWRCADRFHVLFNHITTPFLVREDFRDPSGQHNDNPAGPDNHGHRLFWADPSLDYCEDPAATVPCPPVLSQADYRARVEEQAERLVRDFDTDSELAATGPVPTVYLWLPDCGQHAGAFDGRQFFDVALESRSAATSTTLHDFLADFMQAPPLGGTATRIDGLGDTRSICR